MLLPPPLDVVAVVLVVVAICSWFRWAGLLLYGVCLINNSRFREPISSCIVYRMKWKIIEHTFCWGIQFGLLPSANGFDNIHTNIVVLPTNEERTVRYERIFIFRKELAFLSLFPLQKQKRIHMIYMQILLYEKIIGSSTMLIFWVIINTFATDLPKVRINKRFSTKSLLFVFNLESGWSVGPLQIVLNTETFVFLSNFVVFSCFFN